MLTCNLIFRHGPRLLIEAANNDYNTLQTACSVAAKKMYDQNKAPIVAFMCFGPEKDSPRVSIRVDSHSLIVSSILPGLTLHEVL